jgi:hypothetical protein
MSAITVKPGATYLVAFGDDMEPVTVTTECPYGGWYGTKSDASRVRFTESRIVHNVQEDTNMAAKPNAKPTVTAADRRARRAKAAAPQLAIEITDTGAAQIEQATDGKVTATAVKEAAKPAAAKKSAATTPTPRNAKGQIQSKKQADKSAAKSTPKPAAKPTPAKPQAAKKSTPKTDNTPKENTVKSTTTRRTRNTAKSTDDQITMSKADLEAMVARMVAEQSAPAAAPAAKPATRKAAKPAAKSAAKTVTLKAVSAKKNSWYFKFQGSAKNPLVTGCYISNETIEAFEEGAKNVTATFSRADGKKHSILFREDGNGTVFNGSLYVMRAALKGSGITESTPVTVTLTVKSDDEITLSISAA